MKMKELEERTGVGREAIRYYIREGLLPEPEKPRRNVAIYSEDHVARIGLIRKLRDERFLPLGVIREILDNPALDTSKDGTFLGLERILSARLGANSEDEMLVEDFLDARSIERDELEAMADFGLISCVETPRGLALRGQDVRIVGIWADLRDAGFDSDDIDEHEFGFERYFEVAESLAEKEVEIFYDTVPETHSTEDAAAIAERGITLVEELFSILHGRAILRRVGKRSGAPAGREELSQKASVSREARNPSTAKIDG